MNSFNRMKHPKRLKTRIAAKKSGRIGYRNTSKEVHCDECNGKAIMKVFKVKCLECGVEVMIE